MKSIAVMIWSFFFFEPVNISVEKWVIEKTSNLCIEGRSNVNNFKCDIVEYLNADTIFLYRDASQAKMPIATRGGFNININRFDCHQNHITTDLKKTLKATENAYMKVNLLTIDYIKPNTTNRVSICIAELETPFLLQHLHSVLTLSLNPFCWFVMPSLVRQPWLNKNEGEHTEFYQGLSVAKIIPAAKD